MEIMPGYGIGEIMARLITHYWDNLIFVLKAKRFLGTPFGTGRGVTQGYPMYPMIFNIVVDAVGRATLEVVCGPQEARHGMGWEAGESNLTFYADDGRIGGRDHIWVQDALTISLEMFQQMGLETEMKKTNALVCTPGYIRGSGVMRPTKRKATREGATFREGKRARIS